LTYDRGILELMTPSMGQEIDTGAISFLVDIVTAAMDIPICSVGSTTFRREDLQRGFEANASFYIRHEESIRGQREVDLKRDPPPDLVLEIEASRSEIDRLKLFASMGVPEVWRCDGQRISIFVLDQGGFRRSSLSGQIPALTSEVLTRFLDAHLAMLSPAWARMVSEWARARDAS
jgi:Uma2 family endonuclease